MRETFPATSGVAARDEGDAGQDGGDAGRVDPAEALTEQQVGQQGNAAGMAAIRPDAVVPATRTLPSN